MKPESILVTAVLRDEKRKEHFSKKLHDQGFSDICFVRNRNEAQAVASGHASEYYLLIDDLWAMFFDLHYFVSMIADEKRSAIVLDFQENTGQELVSIDASCRIGSIGIKDSSWKDGFLERGIALYHKEHPAPTYGIPTPKHNKDVPFSKRKPALFLDRDGVVNHDTAYLFRPEQVVFTNGIVPVIQFANKMGLHVIVLSNQSGVARGKYTEDDVKKLHQYMQEALHKQEARVDGWYYCPYFPEKGVVEKYHKESLLRKPMPGMVLRACQDFSIDLTKSFMIGDKVSDAIQIPGLTNLHLKGAYDLTAARHPVFKNFAEILNHVVLQLKQK